jgi:hypothetical protein
MTMKESQKPPTRKARHLRVPVRPDEEVVIKKMAASTGLSIAAYLRNLGLCYQVRGILDNKRVEELARINGDLGRLGGLLKLWLTDDPRTTQFGESTIRALLSKIEDTQDHMHQVMQCIVLPKTNDHGKNTTPDDETCHDRSLTTRSPAPDGEGYSSSLCELHVK